MVLSASKLDRRFLTSCCNAGSAINETFDIYERLTEVRAVQACDGSVGTEDFNDHACGLAAETVSLASAFR